MSNVLTLRISAAKLARLDRLAAAAGHDRSGYVRRLIEEAIESEGRAGRRQHKFASADLLGSLSIGAGPGTNENVRRTVRQRLTARRETYR
jgi:hypothetical protein